MELVYFLVKQAQLQIKIYLTDSDTNVHICKSTYLYLLIDCMYVHIYIYWQTVHMFTHSPISSKCRFKWPTAQWFTLSLFIFFIFYLYIFMSLLSWFCALTPTTCISPVCHPHCCWGYDTWIYRQGLIKVYLIILFILPYLKAFTAKTQTNVSG